MDFFQGLTESKETFNKIILKNPSSTKTLQAIFDTDPNVFSTKVISELIRLGKQSDFTIRDLAAFSPLIGHGLFNAYIDITDAKNLQSYDDILDAYFKGICSVSTTEPYTKIKNNFTAVLRGKITPDRTVSSWALGVVTIRFKSDAPTSSKKTTSVTYDVANQLTRISEEYSSTNTYTFKSWPIACRIPGALINFVMKCLIDYQRHIINEAENQGCKIKPFLSIS